MATLNNKNLAKLVTVEAMEEFVNTFKEKIFDWTDPYGLGDLDRNKYESIDKSEKGIEGLVPATKQDILNILEMTEEEQKEEIENIKPVEEEKRHLVAITEADYNRLSQEDRTDGTLYAIVDEVGTEEENNYKCIIGLTKEKYNALTMEEKNKNTIYVITEEDYGEVKFKEGDDDCVIGVTDGQYNNNKALFEEKDTLFIVD